ncbi:MAG: alpha-galactosidase [Planctomycetes bacterium]|nr:alpha-galactosidase [Planctomycetota bacterium]
MGAVPIYRDIPLQSPRRFGVETESGEIILQSDGTDSLYYEDSGNGLERLVITAPETPIRRIHVAELHLDPKVFPPETTLFRRAGAYSPGDPAVTVPISVNKPDDSESWKYYEALDDGSVMYASDMFAIIYSPENKRCLIIGFATGSKFRTSVKAKLKPDGRIIVHCLNYAQGIIPSQSSPVESEVLFAKEYDSPEKALEEYLDEVVRRNGSAPAKRFTGWSDWQYYRRSITEKDAVENVDALAAGQYPIEYILIDDGFQKVFGDWLENNERFPHGIEWLAEYIRDKGFKPGIWIAPFTAKLDSRLITDHPDWILKGADGKPVLHKSHMGEIVAVDFTAPGATDWLRNLIDTLVHKYGYRWIKLDGPILRYVEKGRFRKPGVTGVSMIRECLKLIWDTSGGKAIIEGEGYYGPSIGLVHTQRVTQDIQPEWPRLRNTLRDNLASTGYHGKLWTNNPDAFILRDTRSPYRGEPEPEHILTEDELQSEITALALTGGTVMLTDKMDELNPERAVLTDVFIPPFEKAVRPIDGEMMHSPYPERFIMHVKKDWGEWWIGACFNWSEEKREFKYALPPGLKDAVVVDFWQKGLLGSEKGILKLDVPAHGVRAFSIRRKSQKPQIAGIIRHITQGAVEISRCESNDKRLEFDVIKSRRETKMLIDTAGRETGKTVLPENSICEVTPGIIRITLPPGGPYTVKVEWKSGE